MGANSFEKLAKSRRLVDNAKLHESIFGHKPLLTLTPEGAAALSKYFDENQITFSLVGGTCGEQYGVSADILMHFLREAFATSIPDLGAKTLSELLGVVSTGANTYGCEMVVIDSLALEALTQSKAISSHR